MEKVGISIETKADLWLCGSCTPNIPITITATKGGNVFVSESYGWKKRKALFFSRIKKSGKRKFFYLSLQDGSIYYFFEDKVSKRPFEFFFTFESSLLLSREICLN